MQRVLLAILTAWCALIISCTGDVQEGCAFEAEDGSCAVLASSSGALDCKLDDAALCGTVTSFLESGEAATVADTAALVSQSTRIGGGGLAAVCEPDGTFMCHCCSVRAGCYPCPKKAAGSLIQSGDATHTTRLPTRVE
jgi:hypothetical protein